MDDILEMISKVDRTRTIDRLKSLICSPSVNPSGEELECAEIVAKRARFYANSVASEAKVESGTVVHVMRVLRANGMAEGTIVKKKRGGKVFSYRLTEAFDLDKSIELFSRS